MSRRLKAEELRATCDPATLPFRSTAELEPLHGLIGQQRALDATTFGIGMKPGGYNLFVLGSPATGKTTSMRRLLDAAAAGRPIPSDWCYVHNFADPYRPCALELPAGRGRQLRDEMARLVEECKTRLPRLFEGEAFEREKPHRQGVLIPDANVRHLMLREDVAAAVRDERFHVYAVRSVDEGLAVLSGREAGELGPDGRYPEGTFNEAVRQALLRNVERLKALRSAPRPDRTD